MEEIEDRLEKVEDRLEKTSKKCLDAYGVWSKDKKNGEIRESLQETIHELRKVASRIEIEIAISERDEMTQKPIPVPPHRDSHSRAQGSGSDNAGNYQGGNNNRGGGKPRQQRRRQQQKKPAAE